jgi:hypothetical protein
MNFLNKDIMNEKLVISPQNHKKQKQEIGSFLFSHLIESK